MVKEMIDSDIALMKKDHLAQLFNRDYLIDLVCLLNFIFNNKIRKKTVSLNLVLNIILPFFPLKFNLNYILL